MQETIRQQEWKIERLMKDNRALEASNCELRTQLDAIKEENLQVGLGGPEGRHGRLPITEFNCTCMQVVHA